MIFCFSRTLIIALFLSSTLLLFSCSDKKDPLTIDGTSSTFRLKHLTTKEAVVGALGNFTSGWDLGALNITNMGPYPKFPYIYYYTLLMSRDNGGSSNKETIRLHVQAGGPVDSDVTLEAFLEEHEDMATVHVARLKNYPGVYVVKGKENDTDQWLIELYTPHIAKDGNHTMHSIHLTGLQTPPVADEVAVTAMLALLEENKE